MKRRRPTGLFRCCAAALVAASLFGCASLTDSHEAIIRVQTAQDTAKAARLTLQGVKAMHQSDIDRATQRFVQAVGADESYGPAHNNLGLLHYEQGNLYQAVLAFERAMELMPHDPIVYYNLGLTLETAGRVHEALDLYWQAVEMEPVNPNFLGNLVRLRVRLGETGPELTTQLQDLVLIETRPDWRRWADRQLALELNDTLDRGPETPEFNTRRDRTDREQDPSKKIIDLTPTDSSLGKNELRGESEESLPKPRFVPSPEFEAPQIKAPANSSVTIPIQDKRSFEELPPSLEFRR